MFGVENGGECFASSSENTYRKHGASNDCKADGEGGFWAIHVYRIIFTGEFISVRKI